MQPPWVSFPELRGRRVVITGAAGIFGSWIAEAFAAQGARLVLVDLRLDRLVELEESGALRDAQEVVVLQADLCDPTSVANLFEAIERAVGCPDVVVNNAGIYPHGLLTETSWEEWERVMQTNLTAPFLLIKEASLRMIAHGVAGSIVNISSGASVTVGARGVPYSVSKSGLAMLTRGAAIELAPHGIRVNAVGPGFAPGSEVSPLESDYIDEMVARIPLGRTSGPRDASSAVLFLSSESASFITGSTIHVDGGRRAGSGG